MPTIIDVAREAGVSKSAASRALLGQGRISEESRLRVVEAARKLGYVKNAMGQGLAAHQTFTLGVLVRDPAALFYGRMHQALQRRASELGYRVVTTTGNLDLDDERRALQTLLSLRVEGLVVSSGLLPTSEIEPFAGRIPTVIAGRPERGDLVSSVYCDEEDGARQLVRHLLDLGHRTIAVLLVPAEESLTLSARSAEMVREIERQGATSVPLPFSGEDPTVSQAGVRILVRRKKITAIMCPSDIDSLGVLHELERAGIAVPEEVSVTGYDGVYPLTAPSIGLTTLAQPIDQIARDAVDLCIRLMSDRSSVAEHHSLPGQLLPSRSTAAATHRR